MTGHPAYNHELHDRVQRRLAKVAASFAGSAALDAEDAERSPEKPTRQMKQLFYRSRAWKALRYAAMRANREKHGRLTCEVCGTTDGPWHCDHRMPLSRDWSRRLDPDNIQIMCEPCNMGKGNTDSIDWAAPASQA